MADLIYGVILANGSHEDLSRSMHGAKIQATKNGFKVLSCRDVKTGMIKIVKHRDALGVWRDGIPPDRKEVDPESVLKFLESLSVTVRTYPVGIFKRLYAVCISRRGRSVEFMFKLDRKVTQIPTPFEALYLVYERTERSRNAKNELRKILFNDEYHLLMGVLNS